MPDGPLQGLGWRSVEYVPEYARHIPSAKQKRQGSTEHLTVEFGGWGEKAGHEAFRSKRDGDPRRQGLAHMDNSLRHEREEG